MNEFEFEPRPGHQRDRAGPAVSRAPGLVGEVVKAARRGGATPLARGQRGRRGGSGRGRSASLAMKAAQARRRVVVKARVVRHRGQRYSAAPLARHIAYLERDGVAREGAQARLFDADGDNAPGEAFARRCEEDRHHFRFIVSPEDAGDLADLRTFTRELMDDMARDLGTRLDWVAADHWNTAHPHVHVLVRGRAEDGSDLVIDRDYIGRGLRSRAEERATIELGPRTRLEQQRAQLREVAAERWTGLDRRLAALQERDGIVDLRPEPSRRDWPGRSLLIARATTLERRGLARPAGTGQWLLEDHAEASLRALELRTDGIARLHRAMREAGRDADPSRLVLDDGGAQPVLGRLLARGLDEELSGRAYALVEGIDGRTHHLRFDDLEASGDSPAGSIVELRRWRDPRGREQRMLSVRSDLDIAGQVGARGATWLDRQLVSQDAGLASSGFGAEVRAALAARRDHLAGLGLASDAGHPRGPGRPQLVPDLLARLKADDLAAAAAELGSRTGLAPIEARAGDHVVGRYRQRVDLASGRFAMIDEGLGFRLVPWQPALERRLGQAVSGTFNGRGGIDWDHARQRTLPGR